MTSSAPQVDSCIEIQSDENNHDNDKASKLAVEHQINAVEQVEKTSVVTSDSILSSEQHLMNVVNVATFLDSSESRAGNDSDEQHSNYSSVVSSIESNQQSTTDFTFEIPAMRSCRKRSQQSCKGFTCPMCNALLRSKEELSNHVEVELHRLSKPHRVRKSETNLNKSNLRKKQYQEFLRVKHNRQRRIQARRNLGYSTVLRSRRISTSRTVLDGGTSSSDQQELLCPICRLTISGTQHQLRRHIDHCLQYDGHNSDDDIEVDDDDDNDSYEEYEWAGQTHVRATTMVHGALAGDAVIVRGQPLTDDRVNVEEDDTVYYGPCQFTEADLIRDCVEETVNDALLEAVIGSRNTETTDASSSSAEDKSELDKAQPTVDMKDKSCTARSSSDANCPICTEPYSNPLTSIQCWHVHCQRCWLRSLGVKKLCPQCNIITSPRDLRKIYL